MSIEKQNEHISWQKKFRELFTKENDNTGQRNADLLPQRSWHDRGCYVDDVEAFIYLLLAEKNAQLSKLESALRLARPHIQFLIARNPQHEEPHKAMNAIDEALSTLKEKE